jgi:hypothetical protein
MLLAVVWEHLRTVDGVADTRLVYSSAPFLCMAKHALGLECELACSLTKVSYPERL